MAIEGPLRELGIHDVFQLLDLSRKTGMLSVSSKLREDESVVYFDDGSVVHASIRSKSVPIELVLLEAGRITQADLDHAHAAGDAADGGERRGRTIVDSLVRVGALTQRDAWVKPCSRRRGRARARIRPSASAPRCTCFARASERGRGSW